MSGTRNGRDRGGRATFTGSESGPRRDLQRGTAASAGVPGGTNPVNGFEIYVRPERGLAAVQTNDDFTMLVVGWPTAERDADKADVEGNYLSTLDLVPSSPTG